MSKTAYIMDILARGFFIFLVAILLTRRWAWALFFAVGINVAWELTLGRKNWQRFHAQPKQPRRKLKTVLLELWQKIFARERTKSFVVAGIIILIMSSVVRLNTYYLVFACVVFGLAAISRFAPPKKSATMPCESAGNQTSGTPVSPPPAK